MLRLTYKLHFSCITCVNFVWYCVLIRQLVPHYADVYNSVHCCAVLLELRWFNFSWICIVTVQQTQIKPVEFEQLFV